MPEEPTLPELLAQVAKLGAKLDERARLHRKLQAYRDGAAPLPAAIVRARVTNAYRMLMPMASANWGGLIVDSVQDRLEVTGITVPDGDKKVEGGAWGIWQDNQMDSESKLGHDAILTDGRVFALIWPADNGAGEPEITLDDMSQMVVQYREGSRRHRVAALRRWIDDDTALPYANLYRPEGIYKFVGPKHSSGGAGTQWTMREVPGETWPVKNPWNVVPVVEIATNRRLAPGSWGGIARGEFEASTGHIDRIHLKTFMGLVVAFWMGFPLRVLVGEKILKDDEGNQIPPFTAAADSVAQFENPEAKLMQFDAADPGKLSPTEDLEQLAVVTKTPRHYFPLGGGSIANLSPDSIQAFAGPLYSKVKGQHKPFIGEGWEEVLRVAGVMRTPEGGGKLIVPPRASLLWRDHEFRSISEAADAATKLKDVIPQVAIAEKVLNVTPDEIARWQAMDSTGIITELMKEPAPKPELVAA